MNVSKHPPPFPVYLPSSPPLTAKIPRRSVPLLGRKSETKPETLLRICTADTAFGPVVKPARQHREAKGGDWELGSQTNEGGTTQFAEREREALLMVQAGPAQK